MRTRKLDKHHKDANLTYSGFVKVLLLITKVNSIVKFYSNKAQYASAVLPDFNSHPFIDASACLGTKVTALKFANSISYILDEYQVQTAMNISTISKMN